MKNLKSTLRDKPDWYHFQEKICSHFNSIGARAETNVTIRGVRTNHDVDILVNARFLGQDLQWIIEAKRWNNKVNKLHVLGLRTIVDDVGADKGFLISEKGFQSGAIEAAKNTNIKLICLSELMAETQELVQSEILKFYKKRAILIEKRYWSHSKEIRIKYGLSGEMWDYQVNFSVCNILIIAHYALIEAEQNKFPIDLETHVIEKQGVLIANNFQELTNWLNLNLNLADEKMLNAEVEMFKNNDFNPKLIPRDGILGLPFLSLAKYYKYETE